MPNFIFMVVIAIYAVIYILRIARKSRPKAPLRPASPGNLFSGPDDDDERDLPSARAEAYMPPPGETGNIPAAGTKHPADFAPVKPPDIAVPVAHTGKTAAPASGEEIFQRFEKMPPLALAFVLSEIIGQPKGATP